MEKYSDKAILIGIRNRKDSVLEYLYKEYYPQVQRIIIKHGGQEHDARDLFQEALIIIFNRLQKDELVIKSSFHNYFIVLCRFIWFRQNNIRSGQDPSLLADDAPAAEKPGTDVPESGPGDKVYDEYLAGQGEKIYQRHYRKLPGDCKRVLRMFFRRRSFREVSARMDYTGEDYARRKKYLCMRQLLKMINEDPEYIELKKRRKQ